MLAIASSRNVRISPYKLRPYARVIRGKSVEAAHAWLKNCGIKRVRPMIKTIASELGAVTKQLEGSNNEDDLKTYANAVNSFFNKIAGSGYYFLEKRLNSENNYCYADMIGRMGKIASDAVKGLVSKIENSTLDTSVKIDMIPSDFSYMKAA